MVCGEMFALVDITSDARLEERYRTRIPVVEIDGVEWFRYEVDPDALRAAIERHSGPADASS